jgi:hypothetical protein
LACQLCETRKARRACPGVRGDICSICCGTEREESVDCPLDCEYLREARLHEKPPEVDPDKFPNREIEVSESFLHQKEDLLLFLSQTLFRAAMETAGANDNDVRDCLDALIRTYKTLESGIYYDTRPSNMIAGVIYQRLQAALDQYRQEMARQLGMQTIRDVDTLGIYVFLQRLEIQHNNGRRRSKAFLDFLGSYFAGPLEQPA